MLNITVNATTYQAEAGANLLGFLRANGFDIAADCNGRGTCGSCAVMLDGTRRLACEVTLEHDCDVRLTEQRMHTLSDYAPVPGECEPREGFGLAIDLGTTTIAMELIDLASGQSIAKSGSVNPQRAFGADVISRIGAADNGHAEELRALVCNEIAKQAYELLRAHEISPGALADCVIAGNTTMAYLLLGYDCACLGVSPFMPGTPLRNPYAWRDVFPGKFDCPVYVIPWVSAFVGGDIVSGLAGLPFDESFLLADLGTNGEIALYHEGRLHCTASAAGPAFEGMKPGLYGCDVLAICARLLRDGLLDESGFLEDESFGLDQRDIREVQLAKSAVRTGIETLMDIAGRPEIRRAYLCGGFGQALRVQDALDIGLFPAALAGRVVSLGNASLAGAALLLRKLSARAKIDEILGQANCINLAEQPNFNEYFMEYMGFE